MSWARLLATGSGSVRYAIVIEGWPEIWVTDESITLTDNNFGADGRDVRVGLLRKGLKFQERAQLAEGRFEGAGMRFRVVSADNREHALESFARVGVQIGVLAEDLTVDEADEIVLEGGATIGSGDGGYVHIGTEAIAWGDGLSRGKWDTQAQAFEVIDGEDLFTHKVYTQPTTAEGRRITLYAWGSGDDGTKYDPLGAESGAGVPVWRGIVSRPPELGDDGLTWTINTNHIHSVFRQSMSGSGAAVRPLGIYHSERSPIFIRFYQDALPGILLSQTYRVGWHATPQALALEVRELMEDYEADNAPANVASMGFVYDPDGDRFGVQMRIGGSNKTQNVRVFVFSFAMGGVYTGTTEAQAWVSTDGTHRVYERDLLIDGTDLNAEFIAGTDYVCWLARGVVMDEVFVFPRLVENEAPQVAPTCHGAHYALPPYNPPGTFNAFEPFDDDATRAAHHERKIYINRDWSELGTSTISIRRDQIESPPDTWHPERVRGSTLVLEVVDSGFDADRDAWWIEVSGEDELLDFHQGFLTEETVLFPLYGTPATGTDVVGFVQSLIDRAEDNPNDGNVPFIRAWDFDTATEIEHTFPLLTAQRIWAFAKEAQIEGVISEELKLLGYMWSTNQIGQLTFVPMPILTGTLRARASIGTGDILTPEGRQGGFPTYKIQAHGLVSVITVKQGYDGAEDKHTGAEHVVRDATLLSTHKRRGVTQITIAPKSNPRTVDETVDTEEAIQIAARLMSVLGREYAVIAVRVPFTKFALRLGDVVSLTSPHVPTSSGTRGVTDKRCFVIGRSVNLDPADSDRIELELLALLSETWGYCPSGIVTDQNDNGDDEWEIELGAGNAINVLISPAGDGDVAGTFAAGDKVKVVTADSGTPTSVTGTVVSVAGDVVTVQLDGTWTPGVVEWTLQYQDATVATDTQRAYAFVADEDALINEDAPARDFA